LLALSTGAVVSDALDNNLPERLRWLEAVLSSVNPNVGLPSASHDGIMTNVKQDADIRDIVPKIIDVVNQRLTSAYIKLNENTPGSPLLRHISQLVNKGNEMTRAAAPYGMRG
jgi:hypothetical protein